jgi:AraC family transcriptional activator of mtrCDE
VISLDRVVERLDLEVTPFVVREVSRACVVDHVPANGPMIHYFPAGAGVVELVDGEAARFAAPSVVLVPPRRRGRIVLEIGARGSRTGGRIGPPAPRVMAVGRRANTMLIASVGIRVTYQGSVGLFDHLRTPVVEDLAGGEDPIRRCFEELLDETATERPGSRAMTELLLRRCLILLLRRCLERGDHWLSWLAASEDVRLARALAAMQHDPAHAFTLRELAALAGMSRSVFAARFASAIGHSPIEFLKTVRLARAAQFLTRTDLPVKSVAARVGYSSRSSFTRAFLARHGAAPAAFRAGPTASGTSASPGDAKIA